MWFAYIYLALQKIGIKHLGVFSKIRNYTGFRTLNNCHPLDISLHSNTGASQDVPGGAAALAGS